MDRVLDLFRIRKHPRWQERTDILGLNIGWRNRIPDMDPLLPFKAWLSCYLFGIDSISVLVGGCSLVGNDWFSALPEPTIVSTSIYSGDLFASTAGHPSSYGYFFKRVDGALLGSLMDECYPGDNALLILPAIGNVTQVLAILNGFQSKTTTLNRLQALVGWVIAPGHDGYYLEVWDQGPNEAKMRSCCKRVVETLETVPWLQKHGQALQWDPEYECYSFPG